MTKFSPAVNTTQILYNSLDMPESNAAIIFNVYHIIAYE
jgi:hypothetical protein